MTEQEAKAKWCPFARAQTEDTPTAPAVNRTLHGQIDIGCHCIGSACMAWRWMAAGEYAIELAATKGLAEHFATRDGKQVGGYCGLAGKP